MENSVLINAFNKHIETAGLGDDDVVTVRECRDALVHVVEQQPAYIRAASGAFTERHGHDTDTND
jgi:hypothetical protein